ncbi:transcription termination factor MTEF18, mitochondrial-like [Apium graveolens]|uniref:transcription termination factor MTEF18, mitochondrial-like n=1 Tax=Apium graveolens TaxID=4045 RepID=UPI003D7B6B8E
MAKVDYSFLEFSSNLQRYLSYYPINEFEFFYESIGISYDEINGFLPRGKFFLSEDFSSYDVACALWEFGFPWEKLGVLCKEKDSVFTRSVSEVNECLLRFKEYEFDGIMIIGVCLAFPFVFRRECELRGEVEALFDVLRTVFLDYELVKFVDGNVDAWFDVCRKIRVFYDLGCARGNMGELLGRSKNVLLEYTEEMLVKKVEFFRKLDVPKEEIGLFLLSKTDVFEFDLESRCFSVVGILKYFGLEIEKLKSIKKNYPYVLGRNKIANLPHVVRSLGLNEWFFDRMTNGDHNLLGTYVIGSPDEDLDTCYTEYLIKIDSLRLPAHALCKLNFLHSIGFGETKLTTKALTTMNGSSAKLQDRFNFLLSCGIAFPNLCKMIFRRPKILDQKIELLDQKVKYFCGDMGYSLQSLDEFPAFLNYDLDTRIKPRYRFHMWLIENNLCKKKYAFTNIISSSEKRFIALIYRMHPAAPKKWLASFYKNPGDSIL